MGNESQLNQVSSANVGALDTANQEMGSISNVFGVAGGIASIVGVILNYTGVVKSDLQTILDAIAAAFDQLNAHLKAQDIIQRLTNLDNQIAPAQAALDGLPSDLKANLDPGDRNARIETCATALEALSDAVWYAPYQDQVYWNDWSDYMASLPSLPPDPFATPVDVGYGEIVASPDPNGNVFSYIYILPEYLRALAIFITEAGALDPNFPGTWADDLAKFLQVLQTYHDKIVNEGIIQLSPPAGLDGFFLGAPDPTWHRLPQTQNQLPPPIAWTAKMLWNAYTAPEASGDTPIVGVTPIPTGGLGMQGVSIEYGALEKFSGASAIGKYTVKIGAYTEYGWLSSDSVDPSPYKKFQLRVLKKTKDLYKNIGLPQVWKAINVGRAILGMAPLSRPNFADWSFRGVGNVVGTTSLKAIRTFIMSTPPIDTPPPAGLAPVGFRALLEV